MQRSQRDKCGALRKNKGHNQADLSNNAFGELGLNKRNINST